VTGPKRTAIEYGLIAALISVVIIAAITAVGTQLKRDLQHRQQRDLRGQQLRASFPQAM
jgi:hypothetical protein